MLTVAKVTAGVAAGYADYLEGKTTAGELGDYYLKDGERVEAPGRWVAGSNAVGCDPTQRVAGEQLRALMGVTHPVSGQPLRKVGASGQAVAAIDATFSAPKSVSAVWALADRELRLRIETAHELAVDRALAYATERVAMVRQRVEGDRIARVNASQLIATSWRHTTARAVGGRAPDPQLHSHALLHAAVRGNGRLVAIDSKAWLVHRREIGAAYRTELAHELTKLGYRIERGTGRGGRYFEIDGVPRSLIERWSSRSHQVEQAIEQRLARRRADLLVAVAAGGAKAAQAQHTLQTMERWGRLQPGEDRLLRVSTRSSKQPHTLGDLDHVWRAEGWTQGFRSGDARLASPAPTRPAEPIAIRAALTEFDATFSESEARAVALERSAGTPIDDALRPLNELRAAGELLTLADGRLTTRTHRGVERATVSATEQATARTATPIPEQAVADAAQTVNRRLAASGGTLSGEQRQALELACGERQLVVIEGQAGTGKSTVLQAVALAHQDASRQIVVTSTAALAAERLVEDLRDVGVDTSSYSTAALQHAIRDERLQLSPTTTIIHDEAALASTAEQHRLLAAVEASGARLILVGDPRQNQPVGAGGLWASIERSTRDQSAHAILTTNLRAQHPADQRDQKRFRAGEHLEALRGYATRDRVHTAADQREAEDQALDAAQRDRRDGKRTLVVTQTSNEHLDELNARAQAIRFQAGELGQQSLAVSGRPYRLHAGDEIQLRHTINHPDLGQLRNGTAAQVVRVDIDREAALLELADSRQAELTREQLARADARLAYVQHPFPAQGTTTDTTHLIVAEHATREGTYVGLTRARDQTHIYSEIEVDGRDADPLSATSDRVARTEPDVPSIALPLAREDDVRPEHKIDMVMAAEPEHDLVKEHNRGLGFEM